MSTGWTGLLRCSQKRDIAASSALPTDRFLIDIGMIAPSRAMNPIEKTSKPLRSVLRIRQPSIEVCERGPNRDGISAHDGLRTALISTRSELIS